MLTFNDAFFNKSGISVFRLIHSKVTYSKIVPTYNNNITSRLINETILVGGYNSILDRCVQPLQVIAINYMI